MNTIQEQWEKFSKLTIAKDAPDIQKQETRRAFYAGVEGLLRIQFNIAESSMSEDAAVAIFQEIEDELHMFAQDMRDGKC